MRNNGFATLFLKEKGMTLLYGIFGVTFFTGFWLIAGHAFFSRPGYEQFSGFMPIPALKAFLNLIGEVFFWDSIWASIRRIIFGILLAFILGFPAGILMGLYHRVRIFTYVPIQFLRMISPLSWMPIALLIFSGFESAICFLVMISTIWPILLNTAFGVTHVETEWIEMARDQGANDHQLVFKVIIPAILPSIVSSLRLALGIAWIVLVPAEFLGVNQGLGYLINDARDTLAYDRLMGIIIAIGLIGFFLDAFLQLFKNKQTLKWLHHKGGIVSRFLFFCFFHLIRSMQKRFGFIFKPIATGAKTLLFWIGLDICYIILLITVHPAAFITGPGFILPHLYGIFVGTMVMFTGLGAGILWFPFLTFLGFLPSEIVPISIFNQIMGKGSGSFKYFNDNMLEKKVVHYFIPYTLYGVTIGFICCFFLPQQHEKWLYLIFIVVVLYLLYKNLTHPPQNQGIAENDTQNNAILKKSGPIVLISSIFTGLLSIGNSDWLIPYMEQRLHLDSSKSVATGIFIMFCASLLYLFLTIFCVILNIRNLPENLSILLATCSGVILGGQIGSRLIHFKWLKKHQRHAFMLMLFLSALHIAWHFVIKH